MKAVAILMPAALPRLIWINAQADEPLKSEPRAARRPDIKRHGGKAVITGGRPSIGANEPERQPRGETRENILNFKLTLPRLCPHPGG